MGYFSRLDAERQEAPRTYLEELEQVVAACSTPFTDSQGVRWEKVDGEWEKAKATDSDGD
jgi:hypothetical protein